MTTEAPKDPNAGAAAAPTGDTAATGAGAAAASSNAPDPAATPAPAATTEPAKEQTVPLSRLQAVIAQRAESERAREALVRELKLANDTLEEFRSLGQRAADNASTGTPADPSANNRATAQVRADVRAAQRPLSPEELQRLVAEESARQTFDRRCNDAVLEGRKAHNDFDKVVLGDLTSISPTIDQRSGRPVLPTPLVEAALETGRAAEVLYALGQDVNEASRIRGLRPVAQAVELAKFAAKLDAAQTAPSEETAPLPNVSRAPAPIKPPTKAGSTRPAFTPYDTDNFSTEEWIRQREKQLSDARSAR